MEFLSGLFENTITVRTLASAAAGAVIACIIRRWSSLT
jgi:hypothetical protein